MDVSKIGQHAVLFALKRVCEALERAEQELPHLAAPDGTVAVNIADLRAVIDRLDQMRDTLALGKQLWTGRWNGSEPERGSAVWAVGPHGFATEQIAYIGGDEKTHDAVGQLVAAHNASLLPTPEASS